MARARAAAVCAAFFYSSSVFAADVGWLTYANPRFGVAVDYPPAFSLRDPPPDNGDCQTFRTPRGDAVLLVFGSYNIDHATRAELMQARKEAGVTYSYARAAKSWFVLSGSRDNRISYLRCNLGSGDVIGCFELRYPSADAARWDPIIGRLANSLRIRPVQ